MTKAGSQEKALTAKQVAKLIAKAASDTKAIDIVVLDLGKVTSFTDYFVICSGASDRQVQAIVNAIEDALKDKGRRPLSIEGQGTGHWTLVDYGEVVAHVFHQTEREYYQIERLWNDAPRVNFPGITD
ncbi:MAG: ribosome silencing factor [Deltaproteobacteria bacterium]|nr:ribosome silencing factor [Deltaproteobacteria bacterium]